MLLDTMSLYPLVLAGDLKELATNSVETLLGISHGLEDVVMRHRLRATFYAGFQQLSSFMPQLERFGRLATLCGEVLIFAYPDVPVPEIPGVQIVPLERDAPLVREWFIVFDHPNFGATLLTRQLADDGGTRVRRDVLEFGRGRLYEGLVTFESSIVTAARRSLAQALGRAFAPVERSPERAFAAESPYNEFGRVLVRYLEQNNQKLRGLYHTLAERTRELERLQGVVRTLISQRAWEEAQTSTVTTENRRSTIQVQHLTILVTDIQGFTRLSDTEDPEIVLRSLNQYLNVLATTVYQQQGDIDKFLGDGMLAFFEDGLAAVQAGVMILRRVAAFNAQQVAARQPVLPTRVGLATGLCVIGRVGSQDRQEITVFGDVVNVSSRLQAKAEPGGMVLDHATYVACGHSPAALLTMARIRGKDELQTVYEVMPDQLNDLEHDLVRFRQERASRD